MVHVMDDDMDTDTDMDTADEVPTHDMDTDMGTLD